MRLNPFRARSFDLPLTTWITLGQHRPSLEGLISSIQHDLPLGDIPKRNAANVRYIEKILREEVAKQFSESYRPALEVILNAIDARPPEFEDEYVIRAQTGLKSFAVGDNGRGMGLRDVLTYLITPFLTEKTGETEIGRFGVGFLSTFNYLIHDPLSTRITVTTRYDGEPSYKVHFYATGEKIDDLRMAVEKGSTRVPVGSEVFVSRLFDRPVLRDYLRENLANVPPVEGKILLDGAQINGAESEWSHAFVSLARGERTLRQAVSIAITPKGGIDLTAQGVLVERRDSNQNHLGAVITFPPAIRVVEGRDEFKLDENFRASTYGVFQALESHLQGKQLPAEKREDYFRLIPAIANALRIENMVSIPNIDSLRASLAPGIEYLITSAHNSASLLDFLSPTFRSRVGVVSEMALSHWQDQFKGYEELFAETLDTAKTFNVDSTLTYYAHNPSHDQQSHLFFAALKFHKIDVVGALSIPDATSTPFFTDTQNRFYYNTAHPLFAEPGSPTQTLALYIRLDDFLTAAGTKTKQAFPSDSFDQFRRVTGYAYLDATGINQWLSGPSFGGSPPRSLYDPAAVPSVKPSPPPQEAPKTDWVAYGDS